MEDNRSYVDYTDATIKLSSVLSAFIALSIFSSATLSFTALCFLVGAFISLVAATMFATITRGFTRKRLVGWNHWVVSVALLCLGLGQILAAMVIGINQRFSEGTSSSQRWVLAGVVIAVGTSVLGVLCLRSIALSRAAISPVIICVNADGLQTSTGASVVIESQNSLWVLGPVGPDAAPVGATSNPMVSRPAWAQIQPFAGMPMSHGHAGSV